MLMKMNFAAELKKLLDAEENPPLDPLVEIARAQARLTEAIGKNGAGVSMQVEEIYDIIKETDGNAKEVKNAAKRETQLLGALIAMSDLLDDFARFIHAAGAGHAETIYAKTAEIMNGCGLERIGHIGDRLDPRIHTVSAVEHSDAPPESVIKVLQSGFEYRGTVIRRAAVIISKGSE